MPALYKFPPHPLCPHIQFKQVGRCCEDELPPWPEPSPLDQPGSARYKVTQLDRIAREDSGASNHGGPASGAAGAHEETSAHVAEGGHIVGGCDKPTKESRRERRAATTSQRELDALELQIPYAMTTVPDCTITSAGIHGSILCPAFKREIWEDATGELLHLCHEAAERRSQKTGAFHGIFHEHAEAERLSLDFIQDRMTTDDPIRGYFIRTNDEDRYLQGFIWYTTFTSWTHFFRWDSLAPEAGLASTAEKYPVKWDQDGWLAGELELQYRSGDPREEGVIWPKVAEVSLTGALGCGEFLMQLVLEEMEAAHAFDYAVVQATESSAGFYDKMGFSRIGAVAKYIKPGEERQAALIPPVAYRHFVGPDQDVKDVDPSIMMAIRLRAGHVPRRIMAHKGGIFPNLGRDVPVGLSAAALDSETVQKLLSSDITGGDIEAKVVGDTLVLGPGASDFSLRLLAEHMGGERWERAKAVLCEAQDQNHKAEEIARPGRASSEIARRKMNLWLSPSAHRPWTCYGTIPETTTEDASGKHSMRTNASRGRGHRVIRNSSAARPSPRVKSVESPGTFSAEDTPRRRKPAGLDLSECGDGKKPSRVGRSPGSQHDVISPMPMAEDGRASPTGGISRLRKETVRDVCIALNIPITRKLPFTKLNATKSKQQLIGNLLKFNKESPIGWLNSDAVSVETLKNVCIDLHLPCDGSGIELRALLVQTLADNLGEYLPSSVGPASIRKDTFEAVDKKAHKKRMPQEGGVKIEKAEGVPPPATNSDEKEEDETCVWDLVMCESCGSGEREERIILCDGCDKAYHLECTTPVLDEVPQGEWYCVSCGERERKAQALREERNRKERERRAREKKVRDEENEEERKVREERERIEHEKQLEREERQRKAREQRERRLEEERSAKEKEKEKKLQNERDRKAKELREREDREREEKEERERKAKEREEERERKLKVQAEREAQKALDRAQKEALREGGAGDAKVRKDGKKESEGKKDCEKEAKSPGLKAVKASQVAAWMAPEFADWDVASDEEGKIAWNKKLKHTWYGQPGIEWLTKETLRYLCQELDVPINRRLPCTKITVAKSKQQLIGTLEKIVDEQPFPWIENEAVSEDTLRAVCKDLCVNEEGDANALRVRIRAVFDNPDVYVQRMFMTQDGEATSGMNAWEQIECENCRSTEDEERMVLCDMCDAGYHIDCLEPKLKAIPEGEWICKDCRKSKQKKKRPRSDEESNDSATKDDGKDGKKKRTSIDGKSPRGADNADAGAGATNPWDLVECQHCGSAQDEERMILCDVCDGGYHLYCADPKLKKVPAGDWICQDCVASKTGKKRRRRRSQTGVAVAGSSSSNGKAALNGKAKTEHGCVSMVASEDTGHGGEGIGNCSDAQNPWDLVECQECGSAEGEERMILCDMCDGGFHLECTEPRLKAIPDGEWICKDCSRARKRAQSKKEQEKQYKLFQERVDVSGGRKVK